MSLFLRLSEYLWLVGVYQVRVKVVLDKNVVLVFFSIEMIDSDESESTDITSLSVRVNLHIYL